MPPIGERQLDVLVNGEVADQVEALEDEADLLVADARAVGEVEILDRLAVQQVTATAGRVEQSDDGQQRRFAAARRAGNGDVFALRDVQVNARKRVRLDFIGVEDLGHVFQSGSAFVFISHLVSPRSEIRSDRILPRFPTRHVGEDHLVAFLQSTEISIAVTELRPSSTCIRLAPLRRDRA